MSKNACIVTLAHPRSLLPTRYYFCPEAGIFEFTRIAAPKSLYRSWLLSARELESKTDGVLKTKSLNATKESPATDDADTQNTWAMGHVGKKAEVFAATPIDSLFHLLPVLSPRLSTRSSTTKEPFLACEDHLESLAKMSRHWSFALKHERIRICVEDRLASVCDTVEAGDTKMYRLNEDKLLRELCHKAERMVSLGLPQSMEEKFVRKALEVPMVSLKRETTSLVKPSCEDEAFCDHVTLEPSDSQTSIGTSFSSATSSSNRTTITIPEKLDQEEGTETPPEVLSRLRLRVALTYLLSSYVPPDLATKLTHLLSCPDSPVDFGVCDRHLAQIAELRAQALASRSLGDFSRKRGVDDGEEGPESRAEKKRKKDDEEKRKKAGQSRGVRDLNKVDTSGMKKMSDFFGKGTIVRGVGEMK